MLFLFYYPSWLSLCFSSTSKGQINVKLLVGTQTGRPFIMFTQNFPVYTFSSSILKALFPLSIVPTLKRVSRVLISCSILLMQQKPFLSFRPQTLGLWISVTSETCIKEFSFKKRYLFHFIFVEPLIHKTQTGVNYEQIFTREVKTERGRKYQKLNA